MQIKTIEHLNAFFDVDGTVSFKDGAYELFLATVGKTIAGIYNTYYDWDDKYALGGLRGIRKGEIFQPADSLVPVAFHLRSRGIEGSDFQENGYRAPLVKNTEAIINEMSDQNLNPHLLSAGFQPYVMALGENAGVASKNIIATPYPDGDKLTREERDVIHIVEELLILSDINYEAVIQRLMHETAPRHANLAEIIAKVVVVAGQRKVDRMEELLAKKDQKLDSVLYVGDGFTDAKAIAAVNHAGGLAIAINANKHALPPATVSVATTDLAMLSPVIQAWREGGRAKATQLVRAYEENNRSNGEVFYHVVEGKTPQQVSEILEIHSVLRKKVRAETAHFS